MSNAATIVIARSSDSVLRINLVPSRDSIKVNSPYIPIGKYAGISRLPQTLKQGIQSISRGNSGVATLRPHREPGAQGMSTRARDP
jgi:hypothetical protein